MEHFQLHFAFRLDPHLNTRILLSQAAHRYTPDQRNAPRCEVCESVQPASVATR